MEKLDIILWVIGGGFGVSFSIMILMWNSINSRFDRVDGRIDKLDEKLTDVDRRLCRLEGAYRDA